MHIKSIHLDGFKSYQKHTDILDFSPTFNAITGYNGSGKSNILDSICFIMGINKLDNIRAKSMHELISHGGTKAIVQVRFDNTDKRCSPFGMEHLDEIVVQRIITAQATGKGCATSYTLNGHAATNGKMQDFFRGVGLNVNNPHFLIMQGRITTVLNMKPEEILGMVEEAAGTKMYDQKKKDAEKTMFLKDAKLKEVDRIFQSSIDPRMVKFREDRKNMVEVTRLKKLKENFSRKYEAFQYFQTCEAVKKSAKEIEDAKKGIEDLGEKFNQLDLDLKNKEDEKKKMEESRDDQHEEAALSAAHLSKQSIMLQKETVKNQLVETINKLKKEGEQINKSLSKDREVLDAKRKEHEDSKAANSKDIQSQSDDEALVTKYRNDLESLTRGTIANDKGEHVSIESEIQSCKSTASQMSSGITAAKKRGERLHNQIKHLEGEKATLSARSKSDIGSADNYQKEVDEINKQLQLLGFNIDADTEKREHAAKLHESITKLKDMDTRLLNSYKDGRYALNYQRPPLHIDKFDEKRDVFGYVAHLIKMKPGCEQFAVAADIALGGVLGNVVVSTQDIARILIDGKAFTSRKTMIPVSENARNASSYNTLPDVKLRRAKEIAEKYNDTVTKMIDLIEYPDFISNTILNAVGQILVVDSLDVAREIAYDEVAKTRMITRRGDDVRTNGIMTGGYNDPGNKPALIALEPMYARRPQIEAQQRELDALNRELQLTEASSQKCRDLNNQLATAMRKLAQVKTNINNSEFGIVVRDLKVHSEEYEKNQAEIEATVKTLKDVEDKIKTLESMKNKDKNSQEKRKKELTALLQKAEQTVAQNKNRGEKARREVMLLQATVEEMEKTIKKDEGIWEQKKKECDELEEKLPNAIAALKDAELEQKAAQAKLNDLKNNQRQISTRLGKIAKECDALIREKAKTKSKREEKEKELTSLQQSEASNRKEARSKLKKFEWLSDEEAHFNKKGGLYDFEGYTVSKGKDEIKELTDKIETLERSCCIQNVSNLDTCEAKVLDIKNKRERITEDFNMLKKTIATLDKKKVDELIRAHESVNKDFGQIFNCLLPDAHASLVPPEEIGRAHV